MSPATLPGPTLGDPAPGCPCPNSACLHPRSRVIFTRPVPGQLLRTRKCKKCGRRYRTAERIVATNVPARNEDPSPPSAA